MSTRDSHYNSSPELTRGWREVGGAFGVLGILLPGEDRGEVALSGPRKQHYNCLMPVLGFQFSKKICILEGPRGDGVGECGRNGGEGGRKSQAWGGWPAGHFLPRELRFQTLSCPCR